MLKLVAIFSGLTAGSALFFALWMRRRHEFHDEPRHVLGEPGVLHLR
jgi:hypothetical protein